MAQGNGFFWRSLALALLLCACSKDDSEAPRSRSAADGGGSQADDDAGPYRGDVDAGKRDAGTAGAAAKLTETEACRFYIAYYCERQLSCGLRDLQNISACYRIAAYCPEFAFAPGSTRTSENVLACGKAWLTEPCEDVRHSRLPACGATPGTREAGEPCISNTQCKSARCSTSVVTGSCGKCVDQVQSGGSCDANVACPYDELCVAGKCQPQQLATPIAPAIMYAPGELCEISSDPRNGGCSLGTACFANAAGEPKRCNELPAPGERCPGGLCWGDGLCTQTCAPVYPCPANRMACNNGEVCVCRDESCSWQACAVLRHEDQSCMLPAVPCDDRLECVAGVCKPKDLPSRFEELCE